MTCFISLLVSVLTPLGAEAGSLMVWMARPDQAKNLARWLPYGVKQDAVVGRVGFVSYKDNEIDDPREKIGRILGVQNVMSGRPLRVQKGLQSTPAMAMPKTRPLADPNQIQHQIILATSLVGNSETVNASDSQIRILKKHLPMEFSQACLEVVETCESHPGYMNLTEIHVLDMGLSQDETTLKWLQSELNLRGCQLHLPEEEPSNKAPLSGSEPLTDRFEWTAEDLSHLSKSNKWVLYQRLLKGDLELANQILSDTATVDPQMSHEDDSRILAQAIALKKDQWLSEKRNPFSGTDFFKNRRLRFTLATRPKECQWLFDERIGYLNENDRVQMISEFLWDPDYEYEKPLVMRSLVTLASAPILNSQAQRVWNEWLIKSLPLMARAGLHAEQDGWAELLSSPIAPINTRTVREAIHRTLDNGVVNPWIKERLRIWASLSAQTPVKSELDDGRSPAETVHSGLACKKTDGLGLCCSEGAYPLSLDRNCGDHRAMTMSAGSSCIVNLQRGFLWTCSP